MKRIGSSNRLNRTKHPQDWLVAQKLRVDRPENDIKGASEHQGKEQISTRLMHAFRSFHGFQPAQNIQHLIGAYLLCQNAFVFIQKENLGGSEDVKGCPKVEAFQCSRSVIN